MLRVAILYVYSMLIFFHYCTVHLTQIHFLFHQLFISCIADTRIQHKEEQVTRYPTPSHVQYEMLPTYFKNKYRLKVTLLGTNLLPVDAFIKKNPKSVGVLIS